MAEMQVTIEHTHVPRGSIPEGDGSETDSRSAVWGVEIVKLGRKAVKHAVVRVVTGDFDVHRVMVGTLAKEASTKVNLPKGMSYDSLVSVGLLASDGQVTVVNITHGSQERPRITDESAGKLIHIAAAGLARAMRRGYGMDEAEPPEEPYGLGQLPELIVEKFDVTPEMVAEYEADIASGIVERVQEVSHEKYHKNKPPRGLRARLREGNKRVQEILGKAAADPNSEF